MDYIQLECPEDQVVSLPSGGIISNNGMLLSGDEVAGQLPIQMLQGSSLMVPILVKIDQGQTFLISRQVLGEEVDDGETHYILTSAADGTENGDQVDGEIANLDIANIDYSLVDGTNLVLSEQSAVATPQEINSLGIEPRVCLDVSQLNLIQTSNGTHFLANEEPENSMAGSLSDDKSHLQSAVIRQSNIVSAMAITNQKEPFKRGRGRPKKEDVEDIMDPPIGKGPYKCDTCGAEFEQWSQMKKHKRIHLNEKPFRCKQCVESFNIESNLVLHMATHNLDNLECPECHRHFTRVASLRSHLLLHEKEDNLVCTECSEEFNLLAHLQAHMQKHEDEWVNENVEKVYDCPHCKRHYLRASALKEHMKEHMKVKSSLQHRKHKRHFDRSDFMHKCDICQKQFQKPSQLLRHSRIHTGEKPFECNICDRAFNQKGSLQVHMAKHNGSKPYLCEFCNARFSQKGNRRAHIQRVHSIPQSGTLTYRCTECPCIFRKLGSLNSHMGRAHSRSFGDDAEKDDTKPLQHAPLNVDQIVDDLVALQKATQRQVETQLTENRDILQQAINKSGLEGRPEDGRDIKGEQENKDGSVTGFITLADKALDGTVRRYTIRQRRVGGVRWHQCSFCCKEFKKPSDLVRHIRTHTHEKPFKCQHCFRAFSVKSTLTAHQRTHQAPEKVSCTVCNKQFCSSSSLKVHMRLHTGTLYPCHICQRVFRSASNRHAHWLTPCSANDTATETSKDLLFPKKKKKRVLSDKPDETNSSIAEILLQEPIVMTDSGWTRHVPRVAPSSDAVQRPYRCLQCSAAFRKSSHLKMHYRVHSGERPFKCPHCDRCFIANGVLKAHMQTHENVKAYKCDVCSNTFTTNGSLKRHMATHCETRLCMCPYCKKRFKNIFNCKKHMKVHKQEIALQVSQHLQDKDLTAQRVVVSVTEGTTFLGSNGQIINFTSALADSNEENTETIEAAERVARSMVEEGRKENQNLMISEILEAPAISVTGTRTLGQETLSELSQQLDVHGTNEGIAVESAVPQLSSLAMTLPTAATKLDGTVATLAVVGGDLPVSIGKGTVPHTDLGSFIFGDAFDQRTYEACTFPTISIQGDQLEQTATIEAILPDGSSVNEVEQSDGLHSGEVVVEDSLLRNVAVQPTITMDKNEERLDSSLKCSICDETFLRMPELRAHLITHKKFPCCQCDRILSTASALKLHMKAHDKEKSYVCEQCNVAFNTQQALMKHIIIHSDDSKAFTCEKCAEQVPTMSQLRQHQKMHDRESGLLSPKRKGPQIQLSAEETLALANKNQDSTMSVSEQVLIASAAERNRISEIKDPSKTSDNLPAYSNKCEFCPKSFRKPSDLVRHVRIHTGERPYRCDFCDRTFTVKSTLDSHYKTHIRGSIKLFPCHVCNLRFATKGSLKVHMRIHTGAKPFKCPICSQQFRTSGHRKAHMEMHQRGANGLRMRPRKSRLQRTLTEETVHFSTEPTETDVEQVTELDTEAQERGLVELTPEENAVVSFDLQEIVSAEGSDFQWQLTDSDGVPLGPGTLSQEIIQQLQEQLIHRKMIVQQNGTVGFLPLEDGEMIVPDQVESSVVITDVPNDDPEVPITEVTFQPDLKDPEGFPTMIEITGEGRQTQHGAEMIGMPFEIHTDEHGEVVNIQQALDNDGVIFSDIDIDMDTDVKSNLVSIPDGQKFQVVHLQPETIATSSFDVLETQDKGLLKTSSSIQNKRSKTAKRSKMHLCPDVTCSKVFSKPSQLERHLRIHTGERPFQCNFCQKSFNQKNALMVHLKHHTGERPHACPHCAYRFSQRGNLKAHLKRAHAFELSKEQNQDNSVTDVSPKLLEKSKSAKISKLSHSLFDDDDMLKFGLSLFNK